MKLGKYVLAVFAILVFGCATPARADLKIDVTRGEVNPLPIAIPDFSGSVSDNPQLGQELVQVISHDLDSSGLFRALDKNSFI
ncbi:MAG: Tol-Pal system protein TolB, partial [Alphaproteobacteria bacterium]|nr:Tol-Pal system protein TolB [Alphaproteobacteria bacterium]